MENPRRYGTPPYRVAVLHGGPGAAGEVAPLARHLARGRGVLEPLQTAAGLDAQVEELYGLLKSRGTAPLVVIGHSWGAWLGFILTARYPELVRKLVLVSSGPFEEHYAGAIVATRLARLDADERREFDALLQDLARLRGTDKNRAFARMGGLIARTDSFAPVAGERPNLTCDFAIFRKVWPQAAELRRSGRLLQLGRHIRVPVVAVHGDYDPHPAAGVEEPLQGVLKDFRFVLLKRCGHYPWQEEQAREEFFQLLERELDNGPP